MIKEQGYRYWEPGQAGPTTRPDGCELLLPSGEWVDSLLDPEGWDKFTRRWPVKVDPEVVALKQELVSALSYKCRNCGCGDNLEGCEGRANCRDYQRLQQLKQELA